MNTPIAKATLIAALLVILFSTTQVSAEESAVGDAGNTQESAKVEKEIKELEAYVLPPAGTSQKDVEEVYGPSLTEPVEPYGYVSKAPEKPHFWEYRPLPPLGRNEFRVILLIVYKDGKVDSASFNHLCVAKGRWICDPNSEAGKREALEISQERVGVLADLKAIKEKFKDKLEAASWNKKPAQE